MRSPKVEIIVLKYNQPHYEATTLEAVAMNTDYSNYSLTAYQNERGAGLSETWNKLIERSDADYICLLNSDTFVTAGWLTNLMEVFEKFPMVAAVVPSSNQVFLSQIPVPFDHATLDYPAMQEFADTLMANGAEIEGLPTLSAMCVVFRRDLWKQVGKFDEEFKLYGEDTEFFYRLGEKTGMDLAWHKGVYVHHYKGQSVRKAIQDGELNLDAAKALATELCQRKMPNLQVTHG